MNTRQKAVDSLQEFINSKEYAVLVTGTHQYQKHLLALQMLGNIQQQSTILFRGNRLGNLGTFFEEPSFNFKTGTPYKLGNHSLYVDTINITSWKNTLGRADYGIIYPIDSVCKENSKKRIIDDVRNRVEKKLFLVSWTDNYDYSWLDDFVDRRVVYDVEEEDPEYHRRMLGS